MRLEKEVAKILRYNCITTNDILLIGDNLRIIFDYSIEHIPHSLIKSLEQKFNMDFTIIYISKSNVELNFILKTKEEYKNE